MSQKSETHPQASLPIFAQFVAGSDPTALRARLLDRVGSLRRDRGYENWATIGGPEMASAVSAAAGVANARRFDEESPAKAFRTALPYDPDVLVVENYAQSASSSYGPGAASEYTLRRMVWHAAMSGHVVLVEVVASNAAEALRIVSEDVEDHKLGDVQLVSFEFDGSPTSLSGQTAGRS